MVKDHSDSKRGNPLLPHRLLFPINRRVLLYAPSHRQDSSYHGLCYTSRDALAEMRININTISTNINMVFDNISLFSFVYKMCNI